jgi:hypothetical protein
VFVRIPAEAERDDGAGDPEDAIATVRRLGALKAATGLAVQVEVAAAVVARFGTVDDAVAAEATIAALAKRFRDNGRPSIATPRWGVPGTYTLSRLDKGASHLHILRHDRC